ncbi:MAG: GNAT family N-acetyltransferase [Acidimicrobiales bacterium]
MADPRIPEELSTSRLVLRRWRLSDLDALAEVFARREVWEFPFGRGLTRDETELRLRGYLETWDRDGFGKYAVELAGTGALIGYSGLEVVTWFDEIEGEVEIGWRLDPGHWGRGYAAEAGLASLQLGFDRLGIDRVVAVIEPANVASSRLARRIGLRAVRETVEPKFNKLLDVWVVERDGFAELLGSHAAAAGPDAATGPSTRAPAG